MLACFPNLSLIIFDILIVQTPGSPWLACSLHISHAQELVRAPYSGRNKIVIQPCTCQPFLHPLYTACTSLDER